MGKKEKLARSKAKSGGSKDVKATKQDRKQERNKERKERGDRPTNKENGATTDAALPPAIDAMNHIASISRTLLDDILALGGDEDDLRLLDDVDSEAEFEGEDAAVDAKLSKELRSFVKGLDFSTFKDADTPAVEPPNKRQKVEESAEAAKPVEDVKRKEKKVKPAEVVAPASQASSTSLWLLQPEPRWYALALPALPPASTTSLKPERIEKLRTRAHELLQALGEQYAAALSPSAGKNALPTPLSASDKVFLSNVLSSGTSADRLSALILIASSAPLHSLSYLSQLLSLCTKKSRDEALRAVQSTADWLRGSEGGLPERKLRWFADQEETLRRVDAAQKGNNSAGTRPGDAQLVLLAFEDRFKQWYLDFLRAIESLSSDPLPYVRIRTLAHIVALLAAKPEQEHNLLALAANALSDQDRGVASKASHLLLQLLEEHPQMKPIVTREVSAVALRPIVEGKLAHGRYYGIITLNQLLLARGETEVANKLIDVYFSIFADLLTRDQAKHAAARASKKGGKPQQDTQHDVEVDSKLLAAVLTGVNRAFPYAALDEAVLKERLDTLYRITHHGAFNVSLQALSLVYRLSMSSTAAGVPSDRFYRTLYDSLIDPRLAYASKHPMYLNLVFKSARADPSHNRQAAFVKRLLQSLAYHQPAYTCGALRLVSELFAVNPALKAMLSDAEEADEEHFADVPEEADEAATSEGEEEEAVTRRYDPRKREPQYAGAEKTCLWEICSLLRHYHPSVRLFTEQLLTGAPSTIEADMEEHALTAFLDRFVYREAKSTSTKSNVFARSTEVKQHRPVNTIDFARTKAESVPVDQLFYHRFFTVKQAAADAASALSKKRKRAPTEDEPADLAGDEEHEASELDEDEVWAAMKATAADSRGFDEVDEDVSEDESLEFDDSEDGAEEGEEDDEEDEEALDGEEAEDLFGSEDEVEVPLPDEAVAVAQGGERGRAKKRKLKSLPLFASADEWATMLGRSDDDE